MEKVTDRDGGIFRRAYDAVHSLVWDREAKGFLAEVFRVCAVAVWKFNQDRGFLRASALTYTSLLSLVPLLALMFSVLKGLGVQRRLEPLLLDKIAIGNEEVVAQIIQYVDRTKIGALGALGLVTLLLTAVSVLGNIELSLNDIWQVRRGRNLLRKVADYLALLIVGPILLLASLSLATTLQSSAVLEKLSLVGSALPFLLNLLPFLAIWLAFTAAYLIMPNRRVPVVSALVGGVSAGILWQIAQGGYLRFQFGMARYNAIYGAMAQLPMLLVWIYLSWCIVLLGAELAFVHQLPGRGRFLRLRHELWVPRLDAALALLLAVARRFERGEPAPSEPELIAELGLHPGEATRVVGRLVDIGLLTPTHEETPGLLPSRSPDRTTVAELVETVTRLSTVESSAPQALAARIRAMVDRELTDTTWAELALAEDA
jgi:membrane protein